MNPESRALTIFASLAVVVAVFAAGYPMRAESQAPAVPAQETAPAAVRGTAAGRGAPRPLPEGYLPLGQPTARGLAPGIRGQELGATGKAIRVTLSSGDEVMSGLAEFAEKNKITSGYILGVGGFRSATFGWYNPEAGGFKKIDVNEKVEVNSFTGNFTTVNGRTNVHIHAMVSGSDGIVHGGHLFEARVNPTMELYIVDVQPAGTPPLPAEGK